jgi:hypothetical protein
LAGRERDVRGRDARFLQARLLVLRARRDVAAVLCTPGAARSAEQSCAARAAAAVLRRPEEPLDAVRLAKLAAPLKQSLPEQLRLAV